MWGALALRLHPDKAEGIFWTDERKRRLTAAFQYSNNVQEQVRRCMIDRDRNTILTDLIYFAALWLFRSRSRMLRRGDHALRQLLGRLPQGQL